MHAVLVYKIDSEREIVTVHHSCPSLIYNLVSLTIFFTSLEEDIDQYSYPKCVSFLEIW